jgi:hypothetical protein
MAGCFPFDAALVINATLSSRVGGLGGNGENARLLGIMCVKC